MLYICMFRPPTYCNSLGFFIASQRRGLHCYLFIFARLDILIEYFYWPLKSGNIIITVLWFYYIVIAVKKNWYMYNTYILTYTYHTNCILFCWPNCVSPIYIFIYNIEKKVDSTLKLRFVYQRKNNKTILFTKETSQGESLIQLLMKFINLTNMFMAHNAFR